MSAVNLSWSPSGDEIALIEEGRKEWTTISTIRTDGTAHKEILRQQCLAVDSALDWSPDGKKLAFTSCSGLIGNSGLGQPTIAVIDLVTGDTRVLAEGSHPLWSPDGKKLLFRSAGLNIVNSDGTQEVRVLDGELAAYGISWLHSGQGLVFGSARDPDGPSEILRINVDGTGRQRLASGAQQGISFTNPMISPDDQHLIVTADSCFRCSLIDSASLPPGLSGGLDFISDKSAPGVFLIDLATGHEDRLADGSHPSVVWDPH